MHLGKSSTTLPFITTGNKLKVLIDTGSSNSFVTQKIAQKKFKKLQKPDPFLVNSSHGQTIGTHSINLPCNMFNINTNTHAKCKFYVFDFHEQFDLLLGIDNLQLLEATLKLKNNTIEFQNHETPLQFYKIPQTPDVRKYKIPSRSAKQIQLHLSNIKEGTAVIDHKKIGPFEIPNCLVTVKDHFAHCLAINTSNIPQTLTVGSIHSAEEIPKNILDLNHLEQGFPKNNLKSKPRKPLPTIRDDHLNLEEKTELHKLIKEYTDIFYDENEPLSTTTFAEHTIPTTDEIPVYSKSYTYVGVKTHTVIIFATYYNEQLFWVLKTAVN